MLVNAIGSESLLRTKLRGVGEFPICRGPFCVVVRPRRPAVAWRSFDAKMKETIQVVWMSDSLI
jgi:hypothetical protein